MPRLLPAPTLALPLLELPLLVLPLLVPVPLRVSMLEAEPEFLLARLPDPADDDAIPGLAVSIDPDVPDEVPEDPLSVPRPLWLEQPTDKSAAQNAMVSSFMIYLLDRKNKQERCPPARKNRIGVGLVNSSARQWNVTA